MAGAANMICGQPSQELGGAVVPPGRCSTPNRSPRTPLALLDVLLQVNPSMLGHMAVKKHGALLINVGADVSAMDERTHTTESFPKQTHEPNQSMRLHTLENRIFYVSQTTKVF